MIELYQGQSGPLPANGPLLEGVRGTGDPNEDIFSVHPRWGMATRRIDKTSQAGLCKGCL
jgi:hypothetical protein